MPELPEVETVVRTLRPVMAGNVLARAQVLRPDIVHPPAADLPRLLAGCTVAAVERRGKRILMRLDCRATLCIHLGMTGRLTAEDPATPLGPHTHLILDIERPGGRPVAQVRFRDPRRFGGAWWFEPGQAADEGLGPEPLDLLPAQLARLLAGTRRAIKVALLDQGLLAGVGNIYADEALFGAGIHPLVPAHELDLSQVRRLNRTMKRILRLAIESRGSSLRDYVDANGHAGDFQKLHRVYAREGQPCPRCRAPIQRIIVGGRSTHFCPRCQPAST